MKKFIALFILVSLTYAGNAFASDNGGTPFGIYSGASSAIITSAAINVRGFGLKTMTVNGVTITSNPSSITYKNMSGTAIVECAPTSSGPWNTCQNEAGSAVSRTTNGVFQWEDAVAYIRVKWTASSSAVGKKIKMWLNWVAGG